ncbi:MAG: hypothetical protein OEV43_00925 [Coriobacteriia bacterium]|nr:hypothetical protein [Coriobacteriia bacterium]
MTRSMHRRSIAARLLTSCILLVVLVSFTGMGYAVPQASDADTGTSEESSATVPVDPPPEAEEPPAEEPPADEAPAVDDEAEEADVAEVTLEIEPSIAGESLLAPVAPTADAVSAIGSGDVNLEGVRKGNGWVKGNLQSYIEGEWVPYRVWIRNDSDAPVVVPSVTVDAFHYKDGKGIYFDQTGDYLYYTTPTKPDLGDSTLPQAGWIPLSLDSHDVPSSGTYGVDAPALLTVISGGQVTIPANEYAVLYFRGHLALTFYWNTQDPPRDGWGPYTGSPGNMQISGGLPAKTVPLPTVEVPATTINIIKFYDTDHDGVKDADENQFLDGWNMHLATVGTFPWEASKETTQGGVATFTMLPSGMDFLVWEDTKAGWLTNTQQPIAVTTGAEPVNVYIGNYLPEYTKTFDLTFEGSAPAGTTFYVVYKLNGVDQAPLSLGDSPYSAEVTHPVGSVISDVRWYATWPYGTGQSVDILLGTTQGETIEEDVTNPFTYGGTIQGQKFEDLDADGVKDASDPALAGWEIVLQRQVNGGWVEYASDTTDGSGYYSFSGVLPGTYRVSEILKTDVAWTQSAPTAPTYYELLFEAGDSLVKRTEYSGKNFLNWAPASIEGYKFEDENNNAERDQGELGLMGWLIYVDYNDNGSFDAGEPNDTTDADGYYFIDGITPGTYFVREQLLLGWTQSMGTYQVTFESRGHYGGEGQYDFGNWTTGGFEGYKFHDLNADGVWDAGEPGLPDWTIEVRDAAGALVTSTVTAADGYYNFVDLGPGDYVITEVLQAGWTQSLPGAPDYEYEVTLESGEFPEEDYNFGNWTTGGFEGYKFHDLDADGVWDASEPGLEDWIIELSTPAGALVATASTDAGGHYSFTGIEPGDYVITEVLQAGWTQSLPGAPDYYEVTLESGEFPEEDFNFGNWTTATKSGTKFEDLDADGLWDAGEPGLAGWIIFADYDDDGELDAGEPSTLTDGTGYYTLTDVLPGTWMIRELMKMDYDWVQSLPGEPYFAYEESFTSDQDVYNNDFGNWAPASIRGMKFNDFDGDGERDGGEPGLEGWRIYVDYNGNDALDAGEPYDDTDSNGEYEITGVKPGTYEVREVLKADWTQSKGGFMVTFESRGEYFSEEGEYDFGNWTTGGLEGYKFHDLDADGVWDAGEPGLGGWTIELSTPAGVLVDTTVTESDGYYSFVDLGPGGYVITEVLQAGWTQSLPGAPDYEYEVTLESGEFPEEDFNFGNWTTASVHGYKFHDLNADGVWDDGDEPGLEDWIIELSTPAGALVATASTDAGGHYSFTGIEPGDYVISEVQQAGWTQSAPVSGYYDVTLASGEVSEMSFDFGNWTTTELHGYKFYDKNADGVWLGPDEMGLAGWQINLVGTAGNGDPVSLMTWTDADGSYEFLDLTPGNYTISETLKPFWTQTAPAGNVYNVTLQSGIVPEMSYDFGNSEDAEKTFELTYLGDVPDGASMFVVFNVGGFIFNGNDHYAVDDFDVTLPLVETPPGSGFFTAKYDVMPGTTIYNVRWMAEWNGEEILLGQTSGVEEINEPVTNEFEYSAEVVGSKWNDTNVVDSTLPGDGVWDKIGEPGIAGWTIEIYRMSPSMEWVLYGTALTSGGGDLGAYSFTGLLPGKYYLAEVIPEIGGQPIMTQSAGPMGVGDGQFTVSDDFNNKEEPVDFGNYELALPFPPDVGLVKDVTPTVAKPGDLLTYTITYTNYLEPIPDGEPFTIVDDYDDAHVVVVDAADGIVDDGKITWNLVGPLATGESGSITYTLRVIEDMPEGKTNIDNTAVITLEGDTNPDNNMDSARVVVEEPFLPFTGADVFRLFVIFALALAAGVALRRLGRSAVS